MSKTTPKRFCKDCGREWSEDYYSGCESCGHCGTRLPSLALCNHLATYRATPLSRAARAWLRNNPLPAGWRGTEHDWCFWHMPLFTLSVRSRGVLAELDLNDLALACEAIFGPDVVIIVDSGETRIYPECRAKPIIIRRKDSAPNPVNVSGHMGSPHAPENEPSWWRGRDE